MSVRVGDPVYRFFVALVAVAAVGMTAFMFTLAGRHPAALVPGIVYLVALAALAFSPAGRALAGRIGLGVVLAVAAVAMMGLLFVQGGRNPNSLVFGLMFLLAAIVLTARAPARAMAEAGLPAILAMAASGFAGGITVQLFVAARGDTSSLVFGGLFLLAAVVFQVGLRLPNPARFAVGAVVVAFSAALLYFLVVSGRGGASIGLAALFVAALIGSLAAAGAPRSADPAGDRHVVR
ncbi:YccS family putative transporter [Actinokineospora iranica]|uniref:Uncharacterized protein n=1 Tax=Actinokineospora iranica TaxID=1271860 RepID=A0A1G6V2P0_9PSEU|nr:hypothetical protein [Actinokineospora iranica]SDD47753.1 hypothetical protein SAMN05216174_111211 [Actinokineospora iranica]